MEDVVNSKLDEAILEELKGGSGTVRDIAGRLSARVRSRLEHLYQTNQVTRDGLGSLRREYVFSLPLAPPMKRRF